MGWQARDPFGDATRPTLEPVVARSHGAIVTAEDHYLMGGFGSAVMELLEENQLNEVRVMRLGFPDRIIELAPIVVPGHGPIGGEEEVRELQAYLRACVAAEGDVARLGAGPWDTWTGREHDEVNIERAALLAGGRDDVPQSFWRLCGR